MLDDEGDDNNKSRMSEGVVVVDENHPASSAHLPDDESDDRQLSYFIKKTKSSY